MLGRVGPMFGHVGPMLGPCWAGPVLRHVEACRAYVGPMVRHVGPRWAYVGPMFGHVEAKLGNLANLGPFIKDRGNWILQQKIPPQMTVHLQVVCHSEQTLITVFSSFLGVGFDDESEYTAHLDRILSEKDLATELPGILVSEAGMFDWCARRIWKPSIPAKDLDPSTFNIF